MADFQADPGYAFRMTEGLKALDRQAAARGGLISGAALKASQGYGQDLASQEYMNAFNRFQTNRTNLLNPLQDNFWHGPDGGQHAVAGWPEHGYQRQQRDGQRRSSAGRRVLPARRMRGRLGTWGRRRGGTGRSTARCPEAPRRTSSCSASSSTR